MVASDRLPGPTSGDHVHNLQTQCFCSLVAVAAGWLQRLVLEAFTGEAVLQNALSSCSHDAQVREESWWLVAGEPASDELYALKRCSPSVAPVS